MEVLYKLFLATLGSYADFVVTFNQEAYLVKELPPMQFLTNQLPGEFCEEETIASLIRTFIGKASDDCRISAEQLNDFLCIAPHLQQQ